MKIYFDDIKQGDLIRFKMPVTGDSNKLVTLDAIVCDIMWDYGAALVAPNREQIKALQESGVPMRNRFYCVREYNPSVELLG